LGKRRYKEVKQDDKFHEALSAFWAKVQPYLVPVGIVAGVILVVAAIWLFIVRRQAPGRDAPWAKLYEITKPPQGEAAKTPEEQLEELAEFAREHQREPVAARALFDLARRHFSTGALRRETDLDAARAHFEKSASFAEQLTADFPEHHLVAVAYFEAGKARLELGQYEEATPHFERAAQARVSPYLAALAQWQAARCYQELGDFEKARQALEAVRENQMAGWVAQQAEFQLAQLDRQQPYRQ
jgi:predicted negative regulator of RcsB-dependent stress response